MNFPSCTTLIVTPGASADGRMRVAHSCDDALADHRIVFVPAQDWPQGTMRPVYPTAICEGELPQWNAYLIPRLYLPGRTDRYRDSLEQSVPTLPIGEIPQVPHTYAYLDSNYGILNEAGLMIGECTCNAKNLCKPDPAKRLFYSSELSRIALERCSQASAAVDLMGKLIDDYGLYGTGETLLVADANDAWVMEMAPSPDGTAGLWCAQRVPDGEVFVEANLFRIRDLRPGSPDQKMCRALAEAASAEGGSLDWTAAVTVSEYNHPYYSLRRVWRTFDMIAPSLELPTKSDNGFLTRQYPFSIRPDRPLQREDLFRIYRDHLEGTRFDLTKGAAAGPWGNPNRPRPSDEEKAYGNWERPISMVDTGYAYVCETGNLCWLAMGRPAEVPFVPLAVGDVPAPFEHGSPRDFDPEHCAWWCFNLVSQFSELRYRDMIQEISRAQQLSEGRAALAIERGENTPAQLNALATATLGEWRVLFGKLAVHFDQGYRFLPGKLPQRESSNPDYLAAVGFRNGPIEY